MIRPYFLAAVAFVAASVANGQSPEGPTPSELRPLPVHDTSLVTFLNAVKVLREGSAGRPLMGIRVLESWGSHVEDTDAMRSRVYVTANLDGDELRAFELGDLWEPRVEKIITERNAPVIYLTYGSRTRQRARVEVSLTGLKVTAATSIP